MRRRRHRLFRSGAVEVAKRMPEGEIDRLWKEADEAALAFQDALNAMPEGGDIMALPEYAVFREKQSAFTEEAERQVFGRVLID